MFHVKHPDGPDTWTRDVVDMARVIVAEYRGYEDKSGTLDNGDAWSHRRLNLEDEAGRPTFVKIATARVGEFPRPEKGTMVAYVIDEYGRVQRQIEDAEALAEYLGMTSDAA